MGPQPEGNYNKHQVGCSKEFQEPKTQDNNSEFLSRGCYSILKTLNTDPGERHEHSNALDSRCQFFHSFSLPVNKHFLKLLCLNSMGDYFESFTHLFIYSLNIHWILNIYQVFVVLVIKNK